MRNWKVYGAALASLLVSGAVFGRSELSLVTNTLLGQEEILMTGQDSNGITRVIRTDTSGNLVANPSTAQVAATHGVCINTTLTVGTSSVACPSSPMTARSSILIQLNQAGQNLRITSNGVAATTTTGIKVPDGSSYNDNLVGTVSTQCLCDAASCEVDIVECP